MLISEQLDNAGLDSIQHLAEIVEETVQNLEDLASKKPTLFNAIIMGASLLNNIEKSMNHVPFRDLVSLISTKYKVGDKIISERHLELETGHSRASIREQIAKLYSYGYLYKQHGKNTILIKKFEPKVLQKLP
jgi:transcriptional regulator of heat shock response